MLIAVKVFEIVVDGPRDSRRSLDGRIELMLVVLFLMGSHATFFSPAKYGIVPEMLPDATCRAPTALLEMSTFVAIVLGTAVGGRAVRRVAGPAVE